VGSPREEERVRIAACGLGRRSRWESVLGVFRILAGLMRADFWMYNRSLDCYR
jgi:hypothetical protein